MTRKRPCIKWTGWCEQKQLRIMDQELTLAFELLARRLALMRELAGSLEQVQSAVVHSELGEIVDQTTRQRELCGALRQLESEAMQRPLCASVAKSGKRTIGLQLPEGAVSPLVRERWKTLARQLTEAEMRVGQLNRAYGALLRRAQRTLQIFMRVLASSSNTYAAPKRELPILQPILQEVSHV
jgi:hypothetical protein